MTSREIRMQLNAGGSVNSILVDSYINEHLRKLNIGQYGGLAFNKPISQNAANVLHGRPVKILGLGAKGKHIYEPSRENIWFDPIITNELIDILEAIEQKDYHIF